MEKTPIASAVEELSHENDLVGTGSDRGILSFSILGVPALQAVLQLGLGGLAVFWLGQSVGGLDPVLQIVAMAGLFAAGSVVGYYTYHSLGVRIEDLVNKIVPFSFSSVL